MLINAETGEIKHNVEYDEWGMITAETGDPTLHPFRFAGGLDMDGYYKFGARYYDPENGKWTSKDPILFAGGDVNLYGYVMGDPVNYIDLQGTAGQAAALLIPLAPVVAGGFLGAAANGYVSSLTGGNVGPALIVGAVSGGLGSIPFIPGPLAGAAGAILQSVGNQIWVKQSGPCKYTFTIRGHNIDLQEVAVNGIIGLVVGSIGGGTAGTIVGGTINSIIQLLEPLFDYP